MFKRSQRVQELLRHEISQYLQEVTEPRLGFVTITAVEVSGDLMDAKIFFSVYGSEEEKTESARVLRRLIPDIRRHIGRKLESLYKAPVLHWVYDPTPERAKRVTDILNQLSEEEKLSENSPEPKKRPRKKI